MGRRLQILLIVFTAGLCVSIGACLDKVPEELTGPPLEIPVPTGLRAVVSPDSVTLYWEADADFPFSGFAVYRAEGEGVKYTRVGESPSSPFIDGSVRNGVLYLYKISGLDSDDIEGARSEPLFVRTSVFSIRINNGDEFTNERNVSLFLTASALTQYVRFSEDVSFTGAPWLSYQSVHAFTLSEGQGSKVVYAQFTDEFGNLTDAFSDAITLDIEASIDTLTFSPSSPIPPGATIHFSVNATGAETGGMVQITLPGLGVDIIARDDGSSGDSEAGNGIYERDFTLPSTFRGTDILLTAVFVDEAGNESDEREFPLRLDMTDPPTAVTLYPVVDSTTTSITLKWSKAEEEGFFSYDLYRDKSQGVSEDVSTLVTSIFESETTIHTDTDVLEGETYYYAVYVKNDLKESVKSNERRAETDDIPPTVVVLDTLSSVGTDRVTLTWSQNDDTDFFEYRVYRTTEPGVIFGSGVLAGGSPIQSRYTTFLDDTGLSLADSTYYYRVFVVDKALNTTRSNEESTE